MKKKTTWNPMDLQKGYEDMSDIHLEIAEEFFVLEDEIMKEKEA
ncbi:hypothetical protein P6P90_06820 [Ectobacillus antri]|jgi:hypothetical protein|uniref:Uncharacterized protein n=1 Tax=Ectobacillus antri TaxID=2486280 RepID=A0ABT6H389_9BACI|nr:MULTISPECIES: hypothetical protein [Ectobacillus]MDG4658075.1 hypothetical protein [Ectobacillus antri]MDG5753684.1 hypothetical protein [Ectobacillus antri]